jgi:hypothetical protein
MYLRANHKDADAPLCIHGHRISLPLLADFPKKRKDVNPFHSDVRFCGSWGSYSLKNLDRERDSGPLLIFLDAHTIKNVDLLDISSYKGDVFLFVGDTQHGPLEGFLGLIEMARHACVKKVFFVNNPQHAHWFARTPADFSKFSYLPIGLANHERAEAWESRYVHGQVVHVGNVLTTHAYRKHVLHVLQEHGAPVTYLRTSGYPQANAIYSAAQAALNISLNSDLSFRLSEILVSGGLCISEDLGFVQRANFPLQNAANLVTFDSLPSLLRIISDVKAGRFDRASHSDPFDGHRLETLDDIASFAKPIIEPRLRSWSVLGGNRIPDLHRYVFARDASLRDVEPLLEMDINSVSDLNMFLDAIDLPRLKILVRCKTALIRLVADLVNRFELAQRVSLRVLDCP